MYMYTKFKVHVANFHLFVIARSLLACSSVHIIDSEWYGLETKLSYFCQLASMYYN